MDINKISLILGKKATKPNNFKLFLFLPFLPIVLINLLLFIKTEKISSVENEMYYVSEKALKTKKQRSLINDKLYQYRKSDPNFLENEIETLPILTNQQKTLEYYLKQEAFSNAEDLHKKYNKIKQNNKNFIFIKDENQTDKNLKDTKLALKSPLKIESEDLQKILNKLENVNEISDKTPFILIKNINLTQNKDSLSLNNLEIIKRDF